MINNELRSQVLELLRGWREEDANCYHGLERLIKHLPEGIVKTDLYDWGNDSGLMFTLQDEGLVDMITAGDDPCFMAIGKMEWGW